MSRYLNTDLEDLESDRRLTEIAAAMTEAGVEEITAHFLPRKCRWGRERRVWIMVREGKVVRSPDGHITEETSVSP